MPGSDKLIYNAFTNDFDGEKNVMHIEILPAECPEQRSGYHFNTG